MNLFIYAQKILFIKKIMCIDKYAQINVVIKQFFLVFCVENIAD